MKSVGLMVRRLCAFDGFTMFFKKYSRALCWGGTTLVLVFLSRSCLCLVGEINIMPDVLSVWFIGGLVLSVLYRIANSFGWKLVLGAMNQSVDTVESMEIWLLSESRRWLPGSIWSYSSRVFQGQRLGLKVSVVSASMLLELIVTVFAALVISLPIIVKCFFEQGIEESSLFGFVLIIACGIGTVFAICQTGGHRMILSNEKCRKLSQYWSSLNGFAINPKQIFLCFMFFCIMGLLNGITTLFLTWSIPSIVYPPPMIVVSAVSVAWLIGFFAIFSPGGLFVREAVFAACLSSWVPLPVALSVAVMGRLVQIFSELVGLLFVFVSRRKIHQIT